MHTCLHAYIVLFKTVCQFLIENLKINYKTREKYQGKKTALVL